MKHQTLFNSSQTPLFFQLKTLAKKYLSNLGKNLSEMEIDRYYFILSLIIKHQHCTQQNLSQMIEIDKASMARMVDYLIRQGYANRIVNPDDRRSFVIVPTSQAIAAHKHIEKAFESINAACFMNFSKQETELFYDMLERIHHNLNQLTTETLNKAKLNTNDK